MADRLVGAVGGCEPDLALVELAAQLGEAVLMLAVMWLRAERVAELLGFR